LSYGDVRCSRSEWRSSPTRNCCCSMSRHAA
jgi:hypothetical protein